MAVVKQYTIYALIHPETKQVRYVGYTSKSFRERLSYHYYELSKDRYSYKIHWLRSLISENLKAEIIPLEVGIETLDVALEREVFFISQYDNLVNSTSGGEKNKVFCEGVKLRIGRSMKGKLVGALNPMFGKKREDLRSRNLSNNPMANETTKTKMADTLREKYNTPQYIELHTLSQKTRRIIIQMDLEGKVLKEYPSIKSTVKDGFGSKEVSLCCRGIHKQHKGFKWAFSNN